MKWNSSLLLGLLALHGGSPAFSQSYNIKNDIFWDTNGGKPIDSQGGGIFRFKDPTTNTETYNWR